MNKITVCLLAMGMASCTGATAPSTTNALTANADAQHLGIYSYTVDGDRALMLDQYGMELGQLQISTPAEGRRLIHFELANGTTDEVEVYRPKADGTFFAPISPETVTTAAVADPALAPMLAQHQITFRALDVNRLAPLGTETVATTSACTGGGTPGDPWTYTTPDGCVKSANTSVGCTNVSQLPASIIGDTGLGNHEIAQTDYTSYAACSSAVLAYCNSAVGAGNFASTACQYNSLIKLWAGQCLGRWMVSAWTASCPRVSCGTSGDYDAVPRQDGCYDPGSCSFYTGIVGCTPYH